MTLTPTVRRPYRSSIEVRRLAVQSILKDVAQWADCEPDDKLAEKLAKLAHDDAYAFAKALDHSAFWGVDYDLVEILSGYSDYDAWEQVCKRWVAENGVTVPYTVGQLVTYRGIKCRVDEVEPQTAQLVVQPMEGPDAPRFAKGGGFVVNVEDIAALEGAAA